MKLTVGNVIQLIVLGCIFSGLQQGLLVITPLLLFRSENNENYHRNAGN